MLVLTGLDGNLDFGLLRNLESIIDLNAKVPDRAFELGMAKKKLHGAQILGPSVDQRRLRAPDGVRPVRSRIETNLLNPAIDDPSVLTGTEVG